MKEARADADLKRGFSFDHDASLQFLAPLAIRIEDGIGSLFEGKVDAVRVEIAFRVVLDAADEAFGFDAAHATGGSFHGLYYGALGLGMNLAVVYFLAHGD